MSRPVSLSLSAQRLGRPLSQLESWRDIGLLHCAPSDRAELKEGEEEWLHQHLAIVESLERVLEESSGVESLIMFGSCARGEERSDSDLDLLVGGPILWNERILFRVHLEEAVGRKVDLSGLDELRSAPVVLFNALRDGRALRDTRGEWKRLRGEKEQLRREAEAERASYPAREAAALLRLGVHRSG